MCPLHSKFVRCNIENAVIGNQNEFSPENKQRLPRTEGPCCCVSPGWEAVARSETGHKHKIYYFLKERKEQFMVEHMTQHRIWVKVYRFGLVTIFKSRKGKIIMRKKEVKVRLHLVKKKCDVKA